MDIVSEQEYFSQRLRQALDRAGWKALGASGLAREFNLRSERRITQHAARKWLQGEAIPTQERIQVLAQWLGVPPDWLRFGKTASTPVHMSDAGARRSLLKDVERLNARQFRLVRELVTVLLIDD